MGAYFGHALPGTLFIFLSLYWLIRTLLDFHNTKTKQHVAKLWWKGSGKTKYIEPSVIIVLTVVGMICEWSSAKFRFFFDDKGNFVHLNDFQHMTMYFFFQLAAIVAIATETTRLPSVSLFVATALAYFVEGMLFHLHMHKSAHHDSNMNEAMERMEFEMHLHYLLCVAIFSCAIATSLEILYPHSLVPTLGRIICTFWQGTWFWQVADMLYSSKRAWNPSSGAIMAATCVFFWHLVVVIFFTLAMYVIFVERPGFFKRLFFCACARPRPSSQKEEYEFERLDNRTKECGLDNEGYSSSDEEEDLFVGKV